MCEFFSRQGRTKFTVLRHSNIYGLHDKFDLERSHVLGATVTKALRAPAGSVIQMWGDGSEKRDLLYVGDLLQAVELALKQQKESFGLFNVGSGRAVSIASLAEKIIAATGKHLTIEWDRGKPTIPVNIVLDCSKIKSALGWKPSTSLNEGLKQTVDWARANYSD